MTESTMKIPPEKKLFALGQIVHTLGALNAFVAELEAADDLPPLGHPIRPEGDEDADFATRILAQVEMQKYISRHVQGDWSEMDAQDVKTNQEATPEDPSEPGWGMGRVFSAYHLPYTKAKVWIITEADRSATTVLMPDEY